MNEFIRENRKQLLNWFKKHIQPYQNYLDLIFIKYTEDNKTLLQNTGTFKSGNLSSVIYKQNLYKQNIDKMENVYIARIHNKPTGILWLDDISIAELENDDKTKDLVPYMTIIQTSPNSYQAFIKLSRQLTENEYKPLQDYITKLTGADIGAKGYTQPMRIPFTYSWKHYRETGQPFYIDCIQESEKQLDPDSILSKMLQTNSNTKVTNKSLKKPIENSKYNYSIDVYQMLYDRFYNKYIEKKSPSEIDYMFSLFILDKHKLSIDRAKYILLECSRDLSKRKPNREKEYVDRTISNVSKHLDI